MFTTGTICSGVFFLIGLAIVFSGWMTYRRSNQASNWVSTMGKIKASKVTRTGGNDIKYYANIEYEYSVLGIVHHSNKVTVAELMGIQDTGISAAQGKVKKYPAGSSVTVYYDPEDPHKAILEKGGDSSLLLLGGIFILFAIAFWIFQ